MRRSPAEFYVVYRLILDRGDSDQIIEQRLENDLIFMPDKRYLANLRARLVFPSTFLPMDLTHTISQTFLRSQRVWSLFHPSRDTRDALAAWNEISARNLLYDLISGPHPDGVVLDVFVKRTGMSMTPGGLAEFKHYFWNMRLLTLQDLVGYVKTFLGNKSIIRALNLPQSETGAIVGLARLGIRPRELDEADMLETFTNGLWIDFQEVQAVLEPGLQRATALSMSAKTAMEAFDKKKALAVHRGEVIDQIMDLKARMKGVQSTTLIDLRKGSAPEPIGLLPDPDEEEKTANGKK